MAPCRSLQGAVAQSAANHTRKHWGGPLLLTISVLGTFKCTKHHMGHAALHPIRR